MEIVKSLKDYSKSQLEKGLCQYFEKELTCTLCNEKIKNKKFMIEYLKPLNDFVIYTNYLPFGTTKRLT